MNDNAHTQSPNVESEPTLAAELWLQRRSFRRALYLLVPFGNRISLRLDAVVSLKNILCAAPHGGLAFGLRADLAVWYKIVEHFSINQDLLLHFVRRLICRIDPKPREPARRVRVSSGTIGGCDGCR